jgi:predicted DNA-binding protein
MTRRSGRGTARQTIRVDEATWERFGKLAEKRGTDRSTLLREQIERLIEEDAPGEASDT